jgi:hypothetical protein
MFSFRLNPDPSYPPLQEAGTLSCSRITTPGRLFHAKRSEKGGSLGGGNVWEFRREQKQNRMVWTTLASGSTGSDGLGYICIQEQKQNGMVGTTPDQWVYWF